MKYRLTDTILAACLRPPLSVAWLPASAIDNCMLPPNRQRKHLQPRSPTLIPRSVLFGNPQRASARVSPNGKWLSYLAPVDGILNVWVAPIDDVTKAKAVTNDKIRDIRGYHWAYTGDHILYSQDKAGDENWHIYATDVATGETKDLTPLDKHSRPGARHEREVSQRNPRRPQRPQSRNCTTSSA